MYDKIPNLLTDNRMFDFEECYCLEKVSGVLTTIKYTRDSGLSTYGAVISDILNWNQLSNLLASFDQKEIIVYGVVSDLQFKAFDVMLNGNWLEVPTAETLVKYLKLDFVKYKRIPCNIGSFNDQLFKTGNMVLRPINELIDENDKRIITQYTNMVQPTAEKVPQLNDRELENAVRHCVQQSRFDKVIDQANRLIHATEGISVKPLELSDTTIIIETMLEVIKSEVPSTKITEDLRKAIGKRTAELFKKWLNEQNQEVKGINL